MLGEIALKTTQGQIDGFFSQLQAVRVFLSGNPGHHLVEG